MSNATNTSNCRAWTFRSFGALAWMAVMVLSATVRAGSSREAGDLYNGRFEHSAFLLSNGKVLVFGGLHSGRLAVTYTELFDPISETWSKTGSLRAGRVGHAAARLADGRIFVVGGFNDSYRYEGDPRIVEVYNPSTGDWRVGGRIKKARAYATATLLQDGRVLVVGGEFSMRRTWQIYDPATETFSPRVRMPTGVHSHTATLLADGRVLVAGGQLGSQYASTESQRRAFLFDPATNSWSETGSMLTGHSGHEAILLQQTEEVLVVDGSTSEIYSPASGLWRSAGDLQTTHRKCRIASLPDGRIIATGGSNRESSGNVTVEIFSPASATWEIDGSLLDARAEHTATCLPDGRVLVAGGILVSYVPLHATSTTEIYSP